MQQHFNPQAVEGFRSLQRAELYILLNKLVISPERFSNHIYRFALFRRYWLSFPLNVCLCRTTAGTLTKAVYGYHVVDDNDPYVLLVEKATYLTAESGTAGGTLVDFIPICKDYFWAWYDFALSIAKCDIFQQGFQEQASSVWLKRVESMLKNCSTCPSILSKRREYGDTVFIWAREPLMQRVCIIRIKGRHCPQSHPAYWTKEKEKTTTMMKMWNTLPGLYLEVCRCLLHKMLQLLTRSIKLVLRRCVRKIEGESEANLLSWFATDERSASQFYFCYASVPRRCRASTSRDRQNHRMQSYARSWW